MAIIDSGLVLSTDYQLAKLIERSATSLEIPKSVTHIAPFIFHSYTELQNITIPNSITSIGARAFQGCTELTYLELPDSVTSLGTYVFLGSGLKTIKLSKSISTIPDATFYQCKKLESISIPKNIKTIVKTAFSGCSNLKTVEFEDNGVVSIGQEAFYGCGLLEEVVFPTGLTTVEYRAFYSCPALRKVSLSATITTLSRNIFENCSSLTYVFFMGNTKIQDGSNQSPFTNCNNIRLFDMRYRTTTADHPTKYSFTANNFYLYINVPDNLYDEFVALPNWSSLNLKHFVHSCDVLSFEEIENPIEGDYYSLKGDTNYLNPLGEKQIDIRQYVDGQWIEIDIDA